jgi:hypothetical protein
MVNAIGTSDSEKECLDTINDKFQIIEIKSLEDFNDFKKHPNERKEKLISEIDYDINKIDDDIRESDPKIYDIKQEIYEVNRRITKKIDTKIKLYSYRKKHEIQDEIDGLQNMKKRLEHDLRNLNSKLYSLQQNKNEDLTKKAEADRNIDSDIRKLSELENDRSFLNKLKGAWGEKEVIESTKKSFRDQKHFHLINAFDIDLMAEAFSFKNKIWVKNKIDHILLCPKGFFVIETKAWDDYYQTGIQEITDQLEKSKQVLEKIFGVDNKINKSAKFVVISTKKYIELNPDCGFYSVKLENFKDFINKQDDVLTGGDITIILDKLSPYLNEDHLSKTSKTVIKLKSGLTKTGRFLRSRLKRQKINEE